MRGRGLLKPPRTCAASIFLLAAEPPDPEGGLFHTQQAAEKALKGFLTWHDVPFRRVHELDELGEQCVGIDSSLAELMSRADALTKYAWRFRYPDAPHEPTLDEGRTAFNLAREVMDAILVRLPLEVRP
jgi:HEPN domain-containing protein